MRFEEALDVLRQLTASGVEYVVIGSMAMAVQGLPRATQDLDLFIAPARDNIETAKRALRELFEDPSIEEIDAEEMAGAYPAVQYTPPHGRYSLDLLTRLGEAFTWEDLLASSEIVSVADVKVRVATPTMLYRMKKDTVRPQDRADADRLRSTFDLEDT